MKLMIPKIILMKYIIIGKKKNIKKLIIMD